MNQPDYYSDIQAHLDKLGVNRTMHLVVHSGLRHLGGRAARPIDLVKSLIERVGADKEKGCLLMPTFQNDTRLEDYLYSDPLYNPRTTPSVTGALTQVFMEHFPSRRGYHPWLATSVLGENALDYIKEHHLSIRPHDERSPYYKLIQNPEGYILLLGAGHQNNVCLRVLESIRWPDYPYKAFLDKPITMRYLDYEGIEHKMKTLVPNRAYLPRLRQWGEDLQAQYPEIGKTLVSSLGYSATLLHAKTFHEAQCDALAKGMYHFNRYYCPRHSAPIKFLIDIKHKLRFEKQIFPAHK